MKEKQKRIGEKGLDLLFPPCCPLCHRVLKGSEGMLCRECEKKIHPIREPRCKKCGKPLENRREEYCRDCRKNPHIFEEGRGIFLYDQTMRSSILRYKYGGRRIYGEFYIQALVLWGAPHVRRWQPQGVFAVPMEKKKKRQRGFNQSEQLAKGVSLAFGIPFYEDWIRKSKRTDSQKKLTAAQRRRNLEGAFEGRKGDWGVERALVVDDVYTTGATLDAVAAEMKKHGVKKVCFLTICTGLT